MFNFLRSKREKKLLSLLSSVTNMASGTLTWGDLYGRLAREAIFPSGDMYLSAISCGMNIWSSLSASLPRRASAVRSDTGRIIRPLGPISHPATRIWLQSFNDSLTASRAVQQTVLDTVIDGNSYYIREFNSQGQTSRLHYVDTSRLPKGSIMLSSGGEDTNIGRKSRPGELLYHIQSGQKPNQASVVIPEEHMVHIKGPVFDHTHNRAVGARDHYRTTISTYKTVEEYQNSIFSKAKAGTQLLTTDKGLTAALLNELQSTINESDPSSYDSVEKLFTKRILPHGLKPVQMYAPPEQMMLHQNKAHLIEDVGRWLQMPPALLFMYLGTGAKTEDSARQIQLFLVMSLIPRLYSVAEQFKDALYSEPYRPLYKFSFDRTTLYSAIITEITSALRSLFEIGAVDREFIAEIFGFPIYDDPDRNRRYVPTNLYSAKHSKALEDTAITAAEEKEVQLEMLQLELEREIEIDRMGKQGLDRFGNPLPVMDPNTDPNNPNSKTDSSTPAKTKTDAGDNITPSKKKPRKTQSDESDKSPNEGNRDKRLRNQQLGFRPPIDKTNTNTTDHTNNDNSVPSVVLNAFKAALKGIQNYEDRRIRHVLNVDEHGNTLRKNEPTKDIPSSLKSIYNSGSGFVNTLNEFASIWSEVIPVITDFESSKELVTQWIEASGIEVSNSDYSTLRARMLEVHKQFPFKEQP